VKYTGKHRLGSPRVLPDLILEIEPVIDPLLWALAVVEPCGTSWSVDDPIARRITWHSCTYSAHGPQRACRCGCGDLLRPIKGWAS
jgi:hypothetical protein